MKVQFELVVGANKFTLIEDVESHVDFFKKLHFYSTLPKVGPNGEDDLVLTYRVAQKQYEYFSIVSQKAKMEFKFGQPKDSKGTLFAKGWEPLYQADGEESSDVGPSHVGIGTGITAPTTNVGLAAPTMAATPTPAAAPQQAAPTMATKTTPAPAAAQPTPQVQNQASNILAKFGIAG